MDSESDCGSCVGEDRWGKNVWGENRQGENDTAGAVRMFDRMCHEISFFRGNVPLGTF